MNVGVLRSRLIEWRNPSFVDELRQLRHEDQFRLLWPIAIAAQEEGNLSSPAAALLLELNPPCPLPIANAVVEILTSWDVSIEEVPWYLARQFGRTAVAQAAADLKSSRLDPVERQTLDTIVYWVNLPRAPNRPGDTSC
jgi:hypothetical protein